MAELFVLGVLLVAGVAVFAVFAALFGIVKFAFKVAFVPLAIVACIVGLVGFAIVLPIGLVAIPLVAAGLIAATCLAVVCGICWLGCSALAAIF